MVTSICHSFLFFPSHLRHVSTLYCVLKGNTQRLIKSNKRNLISETVFPSSPLDRLLQLSRCCHLYFTNWRATIDNPWGWTLSSFPNAVIRAGDAAVLFLTNFCLVIRWRRERRTATDAVVAVLGPGLLSGRDNWGIFGKWELPRERGRKPWKQKKGSSPLCPTFLRFLCSL